jgi:probable HAF family extracellular repeat protein
MMIHRSPGGDPPPPDINGVVTTLDDTYFYGVVYVNGEFVALATNTLLLDNFWMSGETTLSGYNEMLGNDNISHIATNGSVIVYAQGGDLFYSSTSAPGSYAFDPVTGFVSGVGGVVESLRYLNDKFVAIVGGGADSSIHWSYDGETWNNATTLSGYTLNDALYDGAEYRFYGKNFSSGVNVGYTTTDFVTFAPLPAVIFPGSEGPIYKVGYGGGAYLCRALDFPNVSLYISANGYDFTAASAGNVTTFNSNTFIFERNGMLYTQAVPDPEDPGNFYIYRTSDGIVWTPVLKSPIGEYAQMAIGASHIMAVSADSWAVVPVEPAWTIFTIPSGMLIEEYIPNNGAMMTPSGNFLVGTAVTGGGGQGAYRWDASGGTVLLEVTEEVNSQAVAISSDGVIVVGSYEYAPGPVNPLMTAYRWTESGGRVDLGIPDGFEESVPIAVSADGNVIVGTVTLGGSVTEAFYWTEAGGIYDIGTFGTGSTSRPYALSGDGTTIVGTADANGELHAFYWTEADGFLTDLGFLGNGGVATATHVSFDGSIIAGESHIETNVPRAWRWTVESGMAELGTFGGSYSNVLGMSSDGSVIAGMASTTDDVTYHAFHWTEAGGMVDINAVGSTYSRANAVSPNGSIIVGEFSPIPGETRAFYWTVTTGMIPLEPENGFFSMATQVTNTGIVTGLRDDGAGVRPVIWTPA